MRALLIRHGQTRGNAAEEFIGSTDEPLSQAGREKAENAKKDPSVKRVFVSPMLRTRETASILFPNAEQTIVPDLREMDFGEFERLKAADMENDPRYIAWSDCAGLEGPPGGESRGDVASRAVPAFMEALRGSSGEDAVFVIHGAVIMVLMDVLGEPKKDFFDWWTPNIGGFSVECIEKDGSITLTDVKRIQF